IGQQARSRRSKGVSTKVKRKLVGMPRHTVRGAPPVLARRGRALAGKAGGKSPIEMARAGSQASGGPKDAPRPDGFRGLSDGQVADMPEDLRMLEAAAVADGAVEEDSDEAAAEEQAAEPVEEKVEYEEPSNFLALYFREMAE